VQQSICRHCFSVTTRLEAPDIYLLFIVRQKKTVIVREETVVWSRLSAMQLPVLD
jgi:hypothetical protein